MELMQRRRKLMTFEHGHWATATGGIVTFSTPFAKPLRSLKSGFAPVQEGTDDSSPDNVRPITGWTGCKVYHIGQRLTPIDDIANPSANYNVTGGSTLIYDSNEGGITLQGTIGAIYAQHWFRVIGENAPSTTSSRLFTANGDITVTLSFDYKHYGLNTVGNTWPIRIGGAQTINIRADGAIPWTHFEKTYSLTKGQLISMLIYRGVYWRNLQVVTGTQSIPDAPYSSTTIPVDWTTEAGTIYGGYVDLVKGEVWSEYEYFDMTTMNFNRFGAGSVVNTYSVFPRAIPTRNDMFCNFLKVVANPNVSNVEGIDWNNSRINVCLLASRGLNSASAFMSWLQEMKTNGTTPTLVARLNSPELVGTVSPVILNTLRGTNNIWSTTNGNVTAEYFTR